MKNTQPIPLSEVLLRLAVQAGLVRLVRYLLSQGADPRCRFDDGHTPLSVAHEHHRGDVVLDLLLLQGKEKS